MSRGENTDGVLKHYFADLLSAPELQQKPLLPADFLVPSASPNIKDEKFDEPSGNTVESVQDSTTSALIEETTVPSQEPSDDRYAEANTEWFENGRPSWAQGDFDVLLFQVDQFTMAVPLITLGQIQQLNDELSPIFGQAPWLLGLQPSPRGQIRVVNTTRYVMPERYQHKEGHSYDFVITLDGILWGLAVNQVNQPIRLSPGDVKWRRDRAKQPWLAGVIHEHMCVLLDVPRLGRMLLDSDCNSRR